MNGTQKFLDGGASIGSCPVRTISVTAGGAGDGVEQVGDLLDITGRTQAPDPFPAPTAFGYEQQTPRSAALVFVLDSVNLADGESLTINGITIDSYDTVGGAATELWSTDDSVVVAADGAALVNGSYSAVVPVRFYELPALGVVSPGRYVGANFTVTMSAGAIDTANVTGVLVWSINVVGDGIGGS